MRIGVATNHKYLDEVQSVSQIFFPHARFDAVKVPSKEGGFYTIASFFENGRVYSEIFCDDHSLGVHSLSLHGWPDCLNDKRLAMLSMYRLMQDTIGAFAPWGALTGVRPTKMIREWMEKGRADDMNIRVLQDIFHVQEDRAQLAVAVAHAENHIAAKINKNDISLYISIPFCPSCCVYCSFNTANKPWDAQAQAKYIQALVAECRDVSQTIRDMHCNVSSIYIGGGTPTALPDDLLESLLGAIQEETASFIIPGTLEYTIEAGRPDTITCQNLRIMRKYGVNRISINPQTFNDQTLKIIGRNHTSRDIYTAFYAAREEGFTCINADIIAGLPVEGPKDMHQTMENLARLAPENITIHTLSVKRASKLNENRTEQVYTPPDATTIKSQLKIAHGSCISQGHSPYYLYRQKNMTALFENTGYSLPGHECLYNVAMMSEVQTVLGIGAGAVTKFIDDTKITRKFNVKNPEIYIERRSNL